jgi:ring-1,2-phenylacetyl-CoA epoxidase subunit PaaE
MKTYFLQVKEIIQESTDCVSIVFWHPISEQIKYKAGQFITICIPGLDGKKIKRSYSMSSSPVSDTAVAVSVKKVPNGFVSNYLNTQVKAGDFLEVIEPMGNFHLEPKSEKRQIALVAAGSGITPLFSILKTVLAAEKESTINLLYGNKTQSEVIFKNQLENLKAQYAGRLDMKYVFSQEGQMQRIDGTLFSAWWNSQSLKSSAEVYMCGPEAMMDAVKAELAKANHPEAQVHYERFNAPVSDIDTPEEEGLVKQMVEVHYEGQVYNIAVEPHQTILEAALDLDIDLPYSCQAGMCTACMGKCTSGKILMDEEDGLTEKEIKEGYVLTCVSHPLTAGVVLEIE